MRDQKMPPSVPISIPRKLFIFSRNRDGDIDLYIIDLNSGCDGSVSVDHELDILPIVRLSGDFFHDAALCVLGSTLYAFEGHPQKLEYSRPGRSVYKLELLNLPSRFKVDKDMLEFVCKMKSDKHIPYATPTPDGKQIIVCSYFPCTRTKNFELFDPAKGKCNNLPNIDIPTSGVQILAFLDKSVLFVQPSEGGMYTLNFVERRSKWKRLDHFHGASSMRGKFEVISGVDICLTPHCAYDIDDSSLDHQENELEDAFQRWDYNYPDLSSFPFHVKLLRLDLILLDVNDLSDYKFGILLTGVEGGSIDIPHLTLDVYSCDLIKCRSVLSEISGKERMSTCMWDRNYKSYPLPHTYKVKTLKFRLGPQARKYFNILSAGSIPQV